jgi:hypothetical protein
MNLNSITWFVGASVLPSFVVAFLGTYVMRRIAPRWGLVDQPNHRKGKEKGKEQALSTHVPHPPQQFLA